MSRQQQIVVLGGGESGCYAARLAQIHGYEVFLSDNGPINSERKSFLLSNEIPFEENGHVSPKLLKADLVVKSPGIPQDHPLIIQYRSNAIPVISEIEWAYKFQSSKIIAITGSNGKTTTTRLIHHILSYAGLDAAMAGNIGDSFSRYVCEKQSEWVVLELSSFQLEDIDSFRPDIAIILNITPDHLDRYNGSMQLYADAKLNMVINMDAEAFFIYNANDEWIGPHRNAENCKAKKNPISVAQWAPNQFFTNDGTQFDVTRSVLKGRHNAFNITAAACTARLCGIDNSKVQEALDTFQNEAHRLEWVASLNEVDFINDSKATNVDAVYYVLEVMQKPVVWLVGGQDKGNDYHLLDSLVKARVKHIIALGADNSKILNHFQDFQIKISDTHSMGEAVQKAFQVASAGDVVLLSPACASFDLFNNYKHRGDLFKSAVLEKKEANNI